MLNIGKTSALAEHENGEFRLGLDVLGANRALDDVRRGGDLAGRFAGDLANRQGRARRSSRKFFESKVRPLLTDNCLECHGPEKHKGGLRLDLRDAMLKGGETGSVVVPGKPDASPLIEAVRYAGEVQMPPKKKLKDEEIAVLSESVKRAPSGLGSSGRRCQRSTKPAATTAEPAHAPSVSAKDTSFWSFQPV